jgi:hypothetical protein
VPYFAVSGGVYSESVETPLGSFREAARDFTARLVPQRGPVRRAFGFAESFGRFESFEVDDTRTSGMVTLGGGVRFATGEHLFVRPDIRAQVLFGDGTRVLGLFSLNFGYRF